MQALIRCALGAVALTFALFLGCAAGADPVSDAFPAQPDVLMGEYVGRWSAEEDVDPDIAARVIPLGGGKYRVVLTAKLDMRCPPKLDVEATATNGRLTIDAEGIRGECDGATFTGGRNPGKKTFTMQKVQRTSPTAGKPAPEGAIVLFDGTSLDAWHPAEGWEITPDGALMVGPKGKYIVSKQAFKDCDLHIEFRLSYMPEARGQGRSNSGVFLQDTYEVQVLDSFGLPSYYDDCGALYKVAAPMVNACYPPGAWQTYDISYRAARFAPDGTVAEYPRMTVRHNGVLIHNDQEMPYLTNWKEKERLLPPPTDPGPIKMQCHGNYVQFRNIWVTPK